MAYALGIVVVIVGIIISIALHEVGHMVPAKKFGVRVSQYMVGFGPTLWSRVKGETEYGIKAIPLGGYVRLIGMYPPLKPGAKQRRGRVADLVNSARDISNEEVIPGEESRAFYNLSAPKKLIVMMGGPLMNLVIAVVLIAIVQVGFGSVEVTNRVGSVGTCPTATAVPSGGTPAAECVESAASQAGILVGDKITAINGTAVTEWDEIRPLVNASQGEAIQITVNRGGETKTITATPHRSESAFIQNKTTGEKSPVYLLGIGGTNELVSQSITTVPGITWSYVKSTAEVVLRLPKQLFQITESTINDQPRDPNSVMSIVGVGRVAGEVSSADVSAAPDHAQVVTLLNMLAGLNIALFVFNLIPLVPLDGGHVVGAVFEGGRRKWAKFHGKADPGPVDTARMVPVAYGVFVVLLAMGLLLIVADIVNPIKLF